MIVKVEIDLSECYPEDLEYDSDLGVGAKSSLSNEVQSVIDWKVTQAIQEKIGGEVERLISKAYEKIAQEKIGAIIDFKIDEFIKEGKVKASYSKDGMIPVEEKLRALFDSHNGWSNPTASMERMGKKFGEECRKRYDQKFAASIVTGLDKQGLLLPKLLESLQDNDS